MRKVPWRAFLGGVVALGKGVAPTGRELPWRALLGGVVALALVVLVEGVLWLARGPVYAILLTLAFGAGAVIIPLWAYGVLDGVPLLSPVLGKLLLTVGMLSIATGVLTQHENNSYSIELADESRYGPPGYWQRFALGWLGITYERTPAAFGDDAVFDADLDALEETDPDRNADDLPGQAASVDIERGGKQSYIRTDVDGDAIFVTLGAKLAELKDSAGLGIPNRVQLESLKEYGGDSSQHDTTTMAAATFAFAVLGAALGYTLFFLGGA